MRRLAALLALTLLASACASPPARRPSGDLVITAEPADPTAERIEGELATFVVKIRNGSARYVILRDLEEPGAGNVITWQRPLPGKLTYRDDADQFLYDASSKDTTARPVFNTSL